MKNLILLATVAILFASCGSKGPDITREQSLADQKKLAMASYLRKNYQQALIDIENAEQIESRDPEVYNIKGLIYFNLREFKRAQEAYNRALELRDDYSEARFNLCGLYLTINEWEKAVRECEVVASDFLYKSRDRAYTHLGVAYYNMGEYEKAEQAFKDALEINPALVYTHNEYGKLYFKTGRIQEAIDSFKRAVQGLDAYDEAHYNLGRAYLEVGNTTDACYHFKKVVQQSPTRLIGINANEYLDTLCSE